MIRIKTYIKLITITLLLTALIVGASFYYGTFNPNKKVIENIQKEFHKKEVAEVIYLGLVQNMITIVKKLLSKQPESVLTF